MSRRPLLHPVGRLAKAQSRMAPGGMLWSESPIPRKYSPRVAMLGDDEAPPPVPVLPQFWWKFDETSGDTYAESVGDAGDMTGGGGGNPPIAPEGSHSAGTNGNIQTGEMAIPAIVPGPGGWIVFDWWMSDLDMTLTGAQVEASIARFVSEGSWVDPYYTPLVIRWCARSPDYTKTLRFFIGDPSAPFVDPGVLAVTGWANPLHVRWRINPATDAWQILTGDTVAGSGTVTGLAWGGLWQAKFAGMEDGSYFDEFKVYGE